MIARLKKLGLKVSRDQKDNVIGFLPGQGETILLSAHLDRVFPGKGHVAIITGDTIKSDGTTNLGADDTAGLSIILETLSEIQRKNIPHPPLLVVFTVEEEIGLCGAQALDLSRWHVQQGIVYDNAFNAGTVVSRSAAYVAVDMEIKGKMVHSGKNLNEGVNVIEIFRKTDFPIGETDNGQTRINVGFLKAGTIRNAVPDKLTALIEIRSFLEGEALVQTIDRFQQAFQQAAEKAGGAVNFTTKQVATAYHANPEEPLLRDYKEVIERRGGKFKMGDTFVVTDANVFRGKGLKVFTISTGVFNEHSNEETVKLSDMKQLTDDLISLLKLLGTKQVNRRYTQSPGELGGYQVEIGR